MLSFFIIVRMSPKRTAKEKKKVASTSGTTCTQALKRSIRRFLNQEAISKYSNIVSHWAILAERSIKLKDFLGFELVTLAHYCGWDKLVEQPHPMYEGLVREFYANFNIEIDTPGSTHQHQAWLRDKWIIFSLEIIHDYYQLTWDNIVPIPGDFPWLDVR